jgi:predicted metalloprotease with PDZ domain
MDVAAQIKDKGKVERGWLGVGIGVDESGRTVIGAVDPESPAELAKLRVGDIALKIGDKDVTSPDVLAAEIRKRKPGQDVTLKVERDGKPVDVKVKLGEMAEADALKEMEVRFPGLFTAPAPLAAPKSAAPEKAPAAPRSLMPGGPEWSFETRKYIGIYSGEVTPELAAYFGVKEGTGLLVSRLTPDGPAEKAKVRVGDVILGVDGKRVESQDQLIDYIQSKAKGAKIKLEILRDKKTVTVEVEVAEEKTGGFFESGDVRGFLESWQGYTDAFEKEIRKWQSGRVPELRRDMKKIEEEVAKKGKAVARGFWRRV